MLKSVSRSSPRVPRVRKSWDDCREGSPDFQRRKARFGVGETKLHRHHIFRECDVQFVEFGYALRVKDRRTDSSNSTIQYCIIVGISLLEALRRDE
jgi:hypothetical protein